MNIKQAKQEIENTVKAYLLKDKAGEYCLKKEKQRPIFLVGAPGIGKTAIMEQVADKLNINLVSYSLTHHTRQSAMGLPFIKEKKYGENMYSVTEYTMSEIIASIYDCMEQTGVKEGILFLDEINCISETLTPIMLQFLQYKTFGKHPIPEGWIMITAGNPPEYNNSVREFDVATLDRLKYILVEPDFESFKEYAFLHGIHPSIYSYLEGKKAHFYQIQSTVDGISFVTARGWEDLSLMIQLYESLDITVEEHMIRQYLQFDEVALDFTQYYQLFCKFRKQYSLIDIIHGTISEEQMNKLRESNIQERLSLLGLMLDYFTDEIKKCKSNDWFIKNCYEYLTGIKEQMKKDKMCSVTELLSSVIIQIEEKKRKLGQTKQLSSKEKQELEELTKVFQEYKTHSLDFPAIKEDFEKRVAKNKKEVEAVKKQLNHLFVFVEEVFGNGQEMMILLTNFTIHPLFTWFLSKFGCEKYFQYNKNLLLYEKENVILTKLREIESLQKQ